MNPERTVRIGEAIFGVFILAIGALIAVQTFTLPTLMASGNVGPKLFPYLIAFGLALIGARLLAAGLRGSHVGADLPQLDWPAVALVSGALVFLILTLEWIGWIVAGTALFAITARAFGSRTPVRDVGIGVALTCVTFLLFDYGLDLQLPVGRLFEPLLD